MKILSKEILYSRVVGEYEIETDKGVRLRFTLTTAGGKHVDFPDDEGAGYDFDDASQTIYDALTDDEQEDINKYITTL